LFWTLHQITISLAIVWTILPSTEVNSQSFRPNNDELIRTIVCMYLYGNYLRKMLQKQKINRCQSNLYFAYNEFFIFCSRLYSMIRLGGLVVECSPRVQKIGGSPVWSGQRLKNWHPLLPWLTFNMSGLAQDWLDRCQYNVTGWWIIFICCMVLLGTGTLKPRSIQQIVHPL